MNKAWVVVLSVIVLLAMLGFYVSNKYNELIQLDEQVKQYWSQVENVYQRRLDLIPNLVETVKGYAAHENETFTAVTEARSMVGGVLPADIINNPEKFQGFVNSQAALSSALSRLIAVSENYPNLKANENFLSLQSQLEGTENRITVERGRYNVMAQIFNTKIKQVPTNLIAALFQFKEKSYFKADDGAKIAPKVMF